jgi:hypothetical protein
VQTKRTLASYKQKKQNGEKFDKVKGSPISIGDCPILLEFNIQDMWGTFVYR